MRYVQCLALQKLAVAVAVQKLNQLLAVEVVAAKLNQLLAVEVVAAKLNQLLHQKQVHVLQVVLLLVHQ